MNDPRPSAGSSTRVRWFGQIAAIRPSVLAIAVVGAVGAAIAHNHPTGTAASDVVFTAAFAALVILAASKAGPLGWTAASGIAAVAGSGQWKVMAMIAFAVSVTDLALGDLPGRPMVGALIGALDVQVLLRLSTGRHLTNATVTAVGGGLLLLSGRSAWQHALRTRAARRVMVGAAVVTAVSAGTILVSALLARHSVDAGMARARAAISAARKGDSAGAATMFDEAGAEFDSAHHDLAGWWTKPALLVPILGQQARALDALSGSGVDLAHAASTGARSADVQSLRVHDGRLDLEQVRRMAAPLAEVRSALARGDDEVTRAASSWLLPPVANRLADFVSTVEHASSDAETASLAIDVLPDLLGATGTRSYFLAFGTPAETRELGGFMGAYGILTATNGKLSLDVTGRVRDLNRAGRGRVLTDPSALPERYRSLQPDVYWQDVTGTSDFPTVANAVRQMWPQSGGGNLDGVMYLDPETLAALLKLTGPVKLTNYDVQLTATNAEDLLLRDQYALFSNDTRHDFLVEAAKTVFRRLTTGDLPAPSKIADVLSPSVDQRRLLLHSFHDDEQRLFERIHADGALPPVRGDFLSVRASNHGLSKIDAYMHRTVTDDVTIDPIRSTIRATVTVVIRNSAPSTGLPDEVIANRRGQPPGTNSTIISVLSPLNLLDVTRDGQSIPRGAFREYGRSVYTAELNVPSGGDVTVRFELEGAIDLNEGYRLDVVPQPMVNPDELHVRVTGTKGWTVVSRETDGAKPGEASHVEASVTR